MLSFICNPAAIDLETNIQEKQDELVFDFPLTCVIPGVLDKRIIKSSANPSCRKLSVKFSRNVFLDSCGDILEDLRSVCREFGSLNSDPRRMEYNLLSKSTKNYSLAVHVVKQTSMLKIPHIQCV